MSVVEVVGCEWFVGRAVRAGWVHDCHVRTHVVEGVEADVAGCAFGVQVEVVLFGFVVGEADLAVDVDGFVVLVVVIEGAEPGSWAERAAGMVGDHVLVLLLESHGLEWT